MRSRVLAVSFFVFLMSLHGGFMSTWAQDKSVNKAVEKSMVDGEFIDLFHKKYPSNSEMTGVERRRTDASNFIQACCKDRDDVVKLLKNNGFKVKTYKNIDPETLDRSIHQLGGIVHDEIVSGERSPGPLQFWRIFTKFRATVYLYKGEVVDVWAVVDTALP